MDIQCSYSVPLNATGTPPTGGDFWQYSQATCSVPYIAQYQSGTSTFYLSNTIDGGQIILIVFVMMFFVAGIIKGLWSFFLK
jgi:hypothetical protein